MASISQPVVMLSSWCDRARRQGGLVVKSKIHGKQEARAVVYDGLVKLLWQLLKWFILAFWHRCRCERGGRQDTMGEEKKRNGIFRGCV